MKNPALQIAICSLALTGGSLASLASQAAVQEKQLHSFTRAQGCGAATMMLADDGNFYGTKEYCGAGFLTKSGTVFQMTPTGKLTTLHTFVPADGENPLGRLVQGADGAFYGTTSFGYGGQYNLGSVYRITSTGDFTTLHTFTNGTDGAEPSMGLVAGPDGAFYGASNGTHPAIYRITASGDLSTLYTFSGSAANTLMLGADGNFYGTTLSGGIGAGTIFKLTPAGEFTTIYSFTYGTDGEFPFSLSQGSNGDLRGTTAGAPGVAFTVTTDGAFTTVHTFNSGVSGLIVGSDGNYYGTIPPDTSTMNGDTFFTMTPAGEVTPLFTFSLDDYSPSAGHNVSSLIQAPDGSFYGTSDAAGFYGPLFSGGGGTVHYGNAFKITLTP